MPSTGGGARRKPVEPKGEQRRRALLEALEDQLRERPLSEVQISDVAAAAGVGRPAFYFYFPTKHAAVAELLVDLLDVLLGAAAGFVDDRLGAREGLEAALGATVAAWVEHRHLMLALIDARDADREVRAMYDEWIAGFVAPIASTIQRERQLGRAPDGDDPELVAQLLLGLNERALERHLRGTLTVGDARQLTDALVRSWLSLIYAGDAGPG